MTWAEMWEAKLVDLDAECSRARRASDIPRMLAAITDGARAREALAICRRCECPTCEP